MVVIHLSPSFFFFFFFRRVFSDEAKVEATVKSDCSYVVFIVFVIIVLSLYCFLVLHEDFSLTHFFFLFFFFFFLVVLKGENVLIVLLLFPTSGWQ